MKVSIGKVAEHLANHSHAWRGVWNRPMYMDEDTMHPFNVARMTNHNVRGRDRIPVTSSRPVTSDDCWENEGGSTPNLAQTAKI